MDMTLIDWIIMHNSRCFSVPGWQWRGVKESEYSCHHNKFVSGFLKCYGCRRWCRRNQISSFLSKQPRTLLSIIVLHYILFSVNKSLKVVDDFAALQLFVWNLPSFDLLYQGFLRLYSYCLFKKTASSF